MLRRLSATRHFPLIAAPVCETDVFVFVYAGISIFGGVQLCRLLLCSRKKLRGWVDAFPVLQHAIVTALAVCQFSMWTYSVRLLGVCVLQVVTGACPSHSCVVPHTNTQTDCQCAAFEGGLSGAERSGQQQ